MATGSRASVEYVRSKELVAKCNLLVEDCHRRLGWQGLPRRVATKENMVALASIDPRLLSFVPIALRQRIACWIVAVLLVGCAWAFTWWLLSGLLVVLPLERIIAKREKHNWMLLASVLLSLEVLANDIAGWGTACPEARVQAKELLGLQPTSWLDFYLPRRANIDAEIW